ncbi:MAG: drug/metabolite transporter (DMT)-like permease [Flavobacteriales bacterium]|jgi:drug/metabolite transporter (DMT)-like permease|tara:strand:+ start:855 stop:1703 length:849 start_codon:yes stop_codon:yes gene_type:complete
MFYLILAIILFSFNNVLWKKNIQITSISFLIAYRSFFTVFITCVILFLFIETEQVTQFDHLKITIGSIFGVIGLFSMLSVLKKSSLQWIGIYNLIGVGYTSLYVLIFEDLEISRIIIGLFLIVTGFLLFIYSNTRKLKLSWKEHLLLTTMILSFSSSSIIQWKNLSTNISPILIIANQETIVFIISAFLVIHTLKKTQIRKGITSHFRPVFLMSIILLTAFTSSLFGLKNTNPLISGSLFLLNPISTILFSSFFFKEKISLKSWLSIIVISIGVYLLYLQTI